MEQSVFPTDPAGSHGLDLRDPGRNCFIIDLPALRGIAMETLPLDPHGFVSARAKQLTVTRREYGHSPAFQRIEMHDASGLLDKYPMARQRQNSLNQG